MYDPKDDMTSFTSYSNSWPAIVDAPVDVAAKVGFPTTPPPKIYFDTTALTTVHHTIDASPIYSKNKLTASDLNTIYQNATNLLGGEFCVVKVTGTNTANGIFENDGSVFTGKMILWINNGRNIVGDFVETSNTANLSVYIGGGSTTTPHFNNFNYARGYLYINSYSVNNFAFGGSGGNCEFDGGVYASESSSLFFHGSGTQTITWDPDVVQELANIGVFNNPNDTSGTPSSSLTEIVLDSNTTRIRPDILSTAL